MNRATLLSILWLAGCAGCAGSYAPRESTTDEPERDLGGYENRIDQLRAELEATNLPSGVSTEALDSDTGPSDCNVAADLRDRICDLSQRICEIADREPSAADVARKCQRARTTCDDARAGVQRGCGGDP